jgi:hypothetical protein
MATFLKGLVAAQPIVREAADPKITLRYKMVSSLTDQMNAVALQLEGKKFTKTRTVKKDGQETTKDVRFRPHFGKNAMGDWVLECRYGNRPLLLPQIKSHAIHCGKELKQVGEVISKLIEATNAGELDALLLKQNAERAAKRKSRNAA